MSSQQQLNGIAKELFWWQPPEISLANPRRFLAQVMTLETWDEVQMVKDFFGWDAFKDALVNAPAGVFDRRSWAYWHALFWSNGRSHVGSFHSGCRGPGLPGMAGGLSARRLNDLVTKTIHAEDI